MLRALVVNSLTKAIVRENACGLYKIYRYTRFWDIFAKRRLNLKGTRHYFERIFLTQRKSRIKIPFKEAPRVSSIHQPLGRMSSEEASAQKTVDFRIRQRNDFGFPSVVSLANLPQRSPFFHLMAFSCERGLEYWPFAILFARVFVPHGKETPIDRWMARLGK